MKNKKEIIRLQRNQSTLKKEIEEIKKSIPVYLVGFIFFAVLIIFLLEDKVYAYFNGFFNFIAICVTFIFIVSILYVRIKRKKIKDKEKKSKDIGINIYQLMKLEDD